MRPCTAFVSIVFLPSLFSGSVFSQPDGVRIEKKSKWVETISFNTQSRPEIGQGSSSYYLLLDEQENTITQEDYYHYAYTILNTEGVQEMSDLSFDFDPAYNNLILHEIKIIRGATVVDQLSKNIQVIQREQSMDRYLYDGTKTAIVNLKDIRVGDIVEYSFTRKGYNPVHQGHVARTSYFDYYQTIDKFYKKLILPADKKIEIKALGKAEPPVTIKNINDEVHYEWAMSKTKTIRSDISTPSWYNAYNGVMLSDFRSWGEVGEWAKTLFQLSESDKRKFKDDVVGNFPAESEEEFIVSVIRFVQDEVRYLGFESGINSHKPYAPVQVYEQRFGDCKDKSLLLITLLKSRGIEAYPMLVNTSLKHALDERLPSGNIFDHCVVQIIVNDEKIYIDPTISSQGGSLHNIYFPDYRRGLVIDDEISGLENLPEPTTPTTTEIQDFELLTIGGEAMLTVRTSYTGSDADYQRSQFANTSLETIKKNYRDYYANLYPDITTWTEPVITDNRETNVFILEEKYKIPTLWKPLESDDAKIYCSFQAQSVNHYFDISQNIKQRTSPYYLSYPVDYYHTINISLPVEWTIEPADKIIENDFYQYEYAVKRSGNEITRFIHYKTKSDHIPVEKVSEYVDDHSKMLNEAVYQLSYDKSIGAAKSPWPGIVAIIIIVIAGVYGMTTLYHKYDPAPFRYMVRGLPIEGWLMLFAIGVVFAPLRLLFDFFSNPDLITGSAWMSWLSARRYGLSAYMLFIQAYNLLQLLFSVLLVLLFFQRRSSFPRLMTIKIAISFAVTLADVVIAQTISAEGGSENFQEIGRTLFAAIIWIPYLNMSERVKETFVIRANGGDNDTPAPQYQVAASESDVDGYR
jgi:hypothetical protein